MGRGTRDQGWGTGETLTAFGRRRRTVRGSWSVVFAVVLALTGCGDDVSTAGDYRDDSSGGVSEAGWVDPAPGPEVPADALFPDLSGEALRAAVDRRFSPTATLGYGRARDVLYAWENERRGGVCGLYTDYCPALPPGDPSQAAGAVGINAEHVWPQSMGARDEPLKSDLHHVFPAREQVNSSRQALPFGEVEDRRADAWYRADQSRSNTPTLRLGEWAERGEGRWEPPESRKGDVARAALYVAALYPDRADPAFFATMRDDLLDWNRRDPPDDAERARNDWVASAQGNANPFVLDPSLADRIWGGGQIADGEPRPGPEPPVPALPSASGLWLSEIHYDNAGEDAGEGVEVAGPDGAALDGWRLAFVNGNGGQVYREVPLAGRLSGRRWVAVEGIQNGAPDGVALVAPDGSVAEAIAWEGAFSAAVGARMVPFRDIGASQSPDTPRGSSLSRPSPGAPWRLGPATPSR